MYLRNILTFRNFSHFYDWRKMRPLWLKLLSAQTKISLKNGNIAWITYWKDFLDKIFNKTTFLWHYEAIPTMTSSLLCYTRPSQGRGWVTWSGYTSLLPLSPAQTGPSQGVGEMVRSPRQVYPLCPSLHPRSTLSPGQTSGQDTPPLPRK